MPGLFGAIEPYRTGVVEVGDGQSLDCEECGSGTQSVVLHGGQGAGCTTQPAACSIPAPIHRLHRSAFGQGGVVRLRSGSLSLSTYGRMQASSAMPAARAGTGSLNSEDHRIRG